MENNNRVSTDKKLNVPCGTEFTNGLRSLKPKASRSKGTSSKLWYA